MPADTGIRVFTAAKADWAGAVLLAVLVAAAGPALAAGAPNPPKPAAAAPAKPAEEPAKIQHLAPSEAGSVLGRPVRGADGHEIGRIVDLLVDQAGHPRAAVIDFGGFMGVGSRKIAVEWHLLHFTPGDKGKPITLELTPGQIKATPEYRPGATPAIVAAPPPKSVAPAPAAKPKAPPGAAPPAASH